MLRSGAEGAREGHHSSSQVNQWQPFQEVSPDMTVHLTILGRAGPPVTFWNSQVHTPLSPWSHGCSCCASAPHVALLNIRKGVGKDRERESDVLGMAVFYTVLSHQSQLSG